MELMVIELEVTLEAMSAEQILSNLNVYLVTMYIG